MNRMIPAGLDGKDKGRRTGRDRGQRSEGRDQRSEIRGQRSEVRDQKSEGRGHRKQ